MRLGRLLGIPVRLHWSFLALAGFATLSTVISDGLLAGLSTLALGVALFGSVVLHELGHAVAARVVGVSTRDITLYPFGGVASLERMPSRPSHEFFVAAAGPLVNALLFGVALVLWLVTGWSWFAMVAGMNLVMGIFNLVPAFPMDGGRILRAALASRLGHIRATDLSIRIGRGFAWLFLIGGVLGSWWSLALVGGFLLFALRMEGVKLSWAQEEARWHARRAASAPYVVRWAVRPARHDAG